MTPKLLYRAAHPALETRWLARHDRQLPVPQMMYVENLSVGGYYAQPWPWPQFVEGIEVPPSRGTILIGIEREILTLEAVMAHEFRHHWQRWNGWRYDGAPWHPPVDPAQKTAAMRRFFLASRSELDALAHEVRHARDDGSRWLWSLCVSGQPAAA